MDEYLSLRSFRIDDRSRFRLMLGMQILNFYYYSFHSNIFRCMKNLLIFSKRSFFPKHYRISCRSRKSTFWESEKCDEEIDKIEVDPATS